MPPGSPAPRGVGDKEFTHPGPIGHGPRQAALRNLRAFWSRSAALHLGAGLRLSLCDVDREPEGCAKPTPFPPQIRDFDGITGTMTFTEQGDPIKCAVIVKISDAGEFEFYQQVCP